MDKHVCIDCSKEFENTTQMYLTEIGKICDKCFKKRLGGYIKVVRKICEIPKDVIGKGNEELIDFKI